MIECFVNKNNSLGNNIKLNKGNELHNLTSDVSSHNPYKF